MVFATDTGIAIAEMRRAVGTDACDFLFVVLDNREGHLRFPIENATAHDLECEAYYTEH